MQGHIKVSFLLLYLLVAFATQTYAENHPQASLFQQGKHAFSEKKYSQALAYFLKAEQQQGASAALDYNIAVCFLHLKQNPQSKVRLHNLSRYPEWEGLANYHLAQLAEREGDLESAVAYYKKTQTAEQEKLRKIAKVKRENIEAQLAAKKNSAQQAPNESAKRNSEPKKSKKKRQKKTTGIVSASAGRDTNAASLADELIERNSSAEDQYTAMLAYVQHYITGKQDDGFKIYGLGFNRHYQEYESLSSRVLGGGFVYEHTWNTLALSYGLRGTTTSVDGSRVANQIQGKFQISKKIHGHSLHLSYSPSQFNASERYAQINGSQHRFEGGWAKTWDATTLKLRYRYETNDRDDLSRDEFYASASPTRSGVKAEAQWKASNALTFALSLEAIDSTYADENRMRDIGGLIRSEKRKSEQKRWELSGRYAFTKQLGVKLLVKNTDNQDNYDLYNYDKQDVSATLEFRF